MLEVTLPFGENAIEDDVLELFLASFSSYELGKELKDRGALELLRKLSSVVPKLLKTESELVSRLKSEGFTLLKS